MIDGARCTWLSQTHQQFGAPHKGIGSVGSCELAHYHWKVPVQCMSGLPGDNNLESRRDCDICQLRKTPAEQPRFSSEKPQMPFDVRCERLQCLVKALALMIHPSSCLHQASTRTDECAAQKKYPACHESTSYLDFPVALKMQIWVMTLRLCKLRHLVEELNCCAHKHISFQSFPPHAV